MTTRGWCPTVYAPMASGDGLLVRVKPPCSRLSPAQARALADAAARDGNGAIELTGRGNLQIRGLRAAGVPRFAGSMVAAGLAHPDAAVERRRTVLLAPLADARMQRVALALEEALAADAGLAALPAKFGFAVGVAAVRADVYLLPQGAAWRVGRSAADAGATDDPVAEALRLAHGALAPPARAAAQPVVPPLVIGPLAGGFGVGLPFGATDAATLAALAECGTLWLTPWRVLVIEAAAPPAPRDGLILDPADPRLSAAACAGRPACASALADTRADATWLARQFPGLALHVSGCAKGCAHPAPAAATLVGRADGYALVRDGAAADPPCATGLTRAAAAALLAP